MRIGCPAAGAFALLLTGCAYVGDPLPPALNIPERVTDLRARQRGAAILLEFTIPPVTTDGLGLRLGAVDLRISTSSPGPTTTDAWAAEAQSVVVDVTEPGPVSISEPTGQWAGQTIFLAIRTASHKRKRSEWSAPVELEVVPPLETPRLTALETTTKGVRLSWTGQPDASSYRVFRRTGGETELVEAATVERNEWLDEAGQPGDSFVYVVQALRQTATGLAESDPSPPRSISPVDRFPPSPPTGLTAVQGIGSVELAWDRSPEEDVAGYRVYRSVDGGNPAPLGEQIAGLSYSDRDVKDGQTLRYQVTAIDATGNESPPSGMVEVTVR